MKYNFIKIIKIPGLILMLCILLIGNLFAQDIQVTGSVLDKKSSRPIQDLNISVFNQHQLIYQTKSDSIGNFKLPLSLIKNASTIKFKSLNYDELIIEKGRKAFYDKNYLMKVFKLNPGGIALDEVIIKAKRRYRDTTKINLSTEIFERSFMINDLFSKYGFHKDANDQLYYNDKLVSNLLVDGSAFFGKNNSDIFHLLPALALENIEIVETNIDSTTNTTMLRSAIKVNLKLKEKYKKGKFGNTSLGFGTLNRYIIANNLYSYKNREQISFTFNANNLNIGEASLDPSISFSANGNDITAKNARFSYNNLIAKKIEIGFSIKGKTDQKRYLSTSERKDEILKQFSKITNKSDSKLSGISDATLSLNYRIDKLNSILFTILNNYDQTSANDSLDYNTRFDTLTTVSNQRRIQKITNKSSLTELTYKRSFLTKVGRSLEVIISKNKTSTNNTELNNIYNLTNQALTSYYLDGEKKFSEKTIGFNSNFTEPLNTTSYLDLFLLYKSKLTNFSNNISSDSLNNAVDSFTKISNQDLQSGMKLQKTFGELSFEGIITGLYNQRNNSINDSKSKVSTINLDFSLNADYRQNSKKTFLFSLKRNTVYPKINQLIELNNPLNLIYQMKGNLDLKPEIKNSVKIAFNLKESKSSTLNINGSFDYYNSKFGYQTNALPNIPQENFIANVGKAIAAAVDISGLRNFSDKFHINFRSAISYLEQPTILNNKRTINEGLIFNQNISTTKEIFKNIINISPTLNASFSKYYLQKSSSNILNLTYSDKISFSLKDFNLDLFPLLNYNHSINKMTTFSMNGAIKKTILKKYGTIWLQGYDLFNSFRFNNNYIGSTYTQNETYSNTHRYFIIGLNFKFNNIK